MFEGINFGRTRVYEVQLRRTIRWSRWTWTREKSKTREYVLLTKVCSSMLMCVHMECNRALGAVCQWSSRASVWNICCVYVGMFDWNIPCNLRRWESRITDAQLGVEYINSSEGGTNQNQEANAMLINILFGVLYFYTLCVEIPKVYN